MLSKYSVSTTVPWSTRDSCSRCHRFWSWSGPPLHIQHCSEPRGPRPSRTLASDMASSRCTAWKHSDTASFLLHGAWEGGAEGGVFSWSSSPLLSSLADTDSTAVAGRGVVAGPLPHFESDAAAAAALAPRRPGGPAAVPERHNQG